MTDHTPDRPENITNYAPWVAKYGLRYAYGLCQCGCGQPAPIMKTTKAREGLIKGQSYRFIRNHHRRVQPSQAPWVTIYGLLQPYGKCQCGCGQDAPITKQTRNHIGTKKGEPARFIHAHGARVQKRPVLPVEKLFWNHVHRTSNPLDCWEWTASVDYDGYGKFGVGRVCSRAHRASYELHYGPIPEGKIVCHKCDNPPCVNPDHLFLGTNTDNMADKIAKKRQPRGEQVKQAKLTEADVIQIRALRKSGATLSELSKLYGVAAATVSDIALRKRWQHVP